MKYLSFKNKSYSHKSFKIRYLIDESHVATIVFPFLGTIKILSFCFHETSSFNQSSLTILNNIKILSSLIKKKNLSLKSENRQKYACCGFEVRSKFLGKTHGSHCFHRACNPFVVKQRNSRQNSNGPAIDAGEIARKNFGDLPLDLRSNVFRGSRRPEKRKFVQSRSQSSIRRIKRTIM